MIQGQGRGVLSPAGREQVKIAALRLRDEALDLIFASDLPRARETLKSVMIYHPLVPVLFSPDLRERAVGEYEGRPKQLYLDAQADSGEDRVHYRPPGGESYADLAARTDRFLRREVESRRGKHLLLCTHGGPIRTMLAALLGLRLDEALDLAVDNASLSVVQFGSAGEVERVTINTQHLIAEAA